MGIVLHRAKFLADILGDMPVNMLRLTFVSMLALSALPAATFAAPAISGGAEVTQDDPIARTTVALVSVFPPAAGATEPSYGICTASILAKNIIVTAAHCVEGAQKAALFFGLNIEKPQAILYADKVAIHPGYDSKKTENDAAVLRFTGEIPAGFEPIELVPSSTLVSKGDMLTLAGYGMTSLKTEQGTGILRKVKEPVYGTDVLQKGTVLFANRPATGACPGDSGGPALVKAGSKNMLLGVASYLLAPDEEEMPCGIAVVYTDLRNSGIRAFVELAKEELQK